MSLKKRLEKAKQDFENKRKFSNTHIFSSTPFDFYCFEKRDKGYYLNPANQRYLNSGSFTRGDILDWIDGTGNVIKDQDEYEYLIWELNLNAWGIMYNKKHYTGITASHDIDWEKGKGMITGKLLPLLKGKQTEGKTNKIFNLIDAYVKAEVNYYLDIKWYAMDMRTFPIDDKGKIILPSISNLDNHIRNELQGLLLGVGTMGRAIGIFDSNGASNTPTIKSNWAWWADVLVHEAEYQKWVEFGLIPEEYQERK